MGECYGVVVAHAPGAEVEVACVGKELLFDGEEILLSKGELVGDEGGIGGVGSHSHDASAAYVGIVLFVEGGKELDTL